ncbi:MAG TPA: hypothetical protein VH184_18650 [Dongiaceae bacterium]|nr:hypothetical protein [Dongiaceae bacterium]
MPNLQARKTPVRLTRIVSAQASSGVSTGPVSSASTIPALLNITSSPPSCCAPSSIIARQRSGSAMSPPSATASPPAAAILAATASAALLRISARIRRAPSDANFIAAASPMPPPAPLMKARLPRSLIYIFPPARSVKVSSGTGFVASRKFAVEARRTVTLACRP